MDLNVFVRQVAEQFEDTDTSQFNPDTKYKETDEWDSLIALTIIAMVDEEYSVKLTGDEIRNSQTIRDLYNIVSEKKGV